MATVMEISLANDLSMSSPKLGSLENFKEANRVGAQGGARVEVVERLGG